MRLSLGALPSDYIAPGNPYTPGTPAYSSFNATAIAASEGVYGAASPEYLLAYTEPPAPSFASLPPQPRAYVPPPVQFVTHMFFNQPTSVMSLESTLQQLLAEDTANPNSVQMQGTSWAARNYADLAKQHCDLYGDDPGCANLSSLVSQYSQKMLDFMQDETAFQSAAGLKTFSPPSALDRVAPTATFIPQVPKASVLSPPQGGSQVNPQSVANTRTISASDALGTPVGTDTGDGFDLAQWMKDNWIIVALAGGVAFFTLKGKS